MTKASEENRERFLQNLRLVNERAQVEPETVDLLESFARLEWDQKHPLQLPPEEPRRLSRKVQKFLSNNGHLSPQARDFLAAYCQRLQEHGLAFILSPAHLAKTLSLAPGELYKLAKQAERMYFSYQIPKRDGTPRTIQAPNSRLKTIQRAILDELLTWVPLSPHAEGFRRNRSIVTNSHHHVGKKIVLKLDLQDFFPSISSKRVFGLFLALGYPRKVSSLLTDLTTYRGALPTGAPTSPALSNLICRRLDRRLSGVGQKMHFDFSRYADDLTISSQNPALIQLLPFIQEIVREEGFEVKTAKTKIQRNGGQQRVTGIVVNQKANIARQQVRTLRAILHNCRTGDLHEQAYQYARTVKGLSNPGSYPLSHFRTSLRGKIDHIRRVNPDVGEKLLADYLSIRFSA